MGRDGKGGLGVLERDFFFFEIIRCGEVGTWFIHPIVR